MKGWEGGTSFRLKPLLWPLHCARIAFSSLIFPKHGHCFHETQDLTTTKETHTLNVQHQGEKRVTEGRNGMRGQVGDAG